MFNYNIDLVFTGDFDQTVLDNSGSPEYDNPEFQTVIRGVVSNIKTVLDVQPGIRQMSTFTDFNGIRYRITLHST
ncbi:MAG: hypothetical protein EBU90_16345 [Proteobacteria bacterium]|nr:hypothetical protein [Pseudomonadota bacterium]